MASTTAISRAATYYGTPIVEIDVFGNAILRLQAQIGRLERKRLEMIRQNVIGNNDHEQLQLAYEISRLRSDIEMCERKQLRRLELIAAASGVQPQTVQPRFVAAVKPQVVQPAPVSSRADGRIEVNVPRDGNCLFHSMFRACAAELRMMGIHDAGTLRTRICKFVVDHSSQFVFGYGFDFNNVPVGGACTDYDDAESWAEVMCRNTVFGDNTCIAAFSLMIQRRVMLTTEEHFSRMTVFGKQFEYYNYVSLVLRDQHFTYIQ